MNVSAADLWAFLPIGYLLTVAIELPLLLGFLSASHPWRIRVFAGFWLTACTYPVVVLVLPPLIPSRWLYLLVAETFAPAAECVLFWLIVKNQPGWDRRQRIRDMATIIAANLASFGIGELLYAWAGW